MPCPVSYLISSVSGSLDFPVSPFVDTEPQQHVPTVSRQYMFTKDLFTSHPMASTDAFTLFVKGALLLGKVKTFNTRLKIRHLTGPAANWPEGVSGMQSKPEFQDLDNFIQGFITTIPKQFQNPVDAEQESKVDPMLYTAHLLPHV